jgi:hypothetical protein
VLSITGVDDTQTTDCTATLSVNEAFAFTYENSSLGATDISVTITKKTDGTGAASIATMNTGNFSGSNPHSATYSFTEDGEYTITFDAKDLSGNTAASVTKTFKVDKTAPVITVAAVDSRNTTVSDYQLVGGNDLSDSNYVDMSLSIDETFYTTNNVNIAILKNGEDVSDTYFTNYGNRAVVSTGNQRFTEDGVYTVSVDAEDALGNKAESYNLVFTIDNTPPTIEDTDALTKLMSKSDEAGELLLNSDDFADILDKGYDALWNVADTSVFKVDIKLDGIDFVDFSDMSDGYHNMQINVTDEAGHTTSREFDFTYDGTAPRILVTGVEDKSIVNEPFTLSISLEDEEDTITKILINDEEVDSSLYKDTNEFQYQVQDYGDYTVMVMAADEAGNISSTYDSESGDIFSFSLREKVSPVMIIIIAVIALLLIALLIFTIIRRKKKNNN